MSFKYVGSELRAVRGLEISAITTLVGAAILISYKIIFKNQNNVITYASTGAAIVAGKYYIC